MSFFTLLENPFKPHLTLIGGVEAGGMHALYSWVQLAISDARRRAPREPEASRPMSTKCDSGGGDASATWTLHRTSETGAAIMIILCVVGDIAGRELAKLMTPTCTCRRRQSSNLISMRMLLVMTAGLNLDNPHTCAKEGTASPGRPKSSQLPPMVLGLGTSCPDDTWRGWRYRNTMDKVKSAFETNTQHRDRERWHACQTQHRLTASLCRGFHDLVEHGIVWAAHCFKILQGSDPWTSSSATQCSRRPPMIDGHL
ncbi:hypothetical protein K491DRAFT_762638 [Lophiostoma macrostomum CBS 122681]|uniref:Uncharacterized protein n=1 Tax=Lophiostoma macrostomum CBS 122681 TaxID=1314788 RepID=A0A6A6SNI4_9PLEO|nr:hypothetical protein K491DRAFT_762638 [Lophiostoma macrostomum CBS 122681]